MKKYDEYEDQPVHKKRPKHAKNRPGVGMRILNNMVELDIYDDVDVDDDDLYNDDTNVENDRNRKRN